jgi:deoxyribodipyrimidine photo-lyase
METLASLEKTKGHASFHAQQIQSFFTRLRWRDHFLQKFESIPWMEYRCINPATETLHHHHQENLERFISGHTGYPFIDACMRSLSEGLWINFRARAMLVSFAAYALNLDWRSFGPHLAQRFLDYEPGIHYSQLQMQSGTTLGSPPRIYNPIKQSLEKDPTGEFIRQWVPELEGTPSQLIHYPHAGLTPLATNYVEPVIPLERLQKVMRANGPKSTPKKITGTAKERQQTPNNSQTKLKTQEPVIPLTLPLIFD